LICDQSLFEEQNYKKKKLCGIKLDLISDEKWFKAKVKSRLHKRPTDGRKRQKDVERKAVENKGHGKTSFLIILMILLN
jgi:hypothetical protein